MDSLNNHPNLNYLASSSPEGLLELLNQIKLPYKIHNFLIDASSRKKFIVFIETTTELKKVKKSKE